MPSLAMHLAIAKKYLEQHPEENEEEFYQGAIAPDMKPILEIGNGRLHYGENSHRPGLNKYYQEEGLNSSYNRGYFQHLLTDYLFYNKFFDEFSYDIYDDYTRMNTRIIKRYGLEIPEDIQKHIEKLDGEIKVIDEDSVYKFIETVGKLDLENYQEQISEKDKEHKIKITGLKEGLLYKHNKPDYFNTHNEEYFYGFENNYGVLVRRVIGRAETEGAREGLYQVTPYGLASKPSKIMEYDPCKLYELTEELDDDFCDELLQMCEKEIGEEITRDASYNFEAISKENVKKIISLIHRLPERKSEKILQDDELNSDLIQEDEIEIR